MAISIYSALEQLQYAYAETMMSQVAATEQAGLAMFSATPQSVSVYKNVSVLAELISQDASIIANLGVRGTNAQPTEMPTLMLAQGQTRKTLFPISQTAYVIGAEQLYDIVPGVELPGDSWTAGDRWAWYYTVGKDQIARAQTRLAESMVWEVLQTGKLVTGNGVIEYAQNPQLQGRGVPVLWSDVANATPFADEGNAALALLQTSHHPSSRYLISIKGRNALNNYRAYIKSQGDLRNIAFDGIRTSTRTPVPADLQWLVDAGLEYHGFTESDGGLVKTVHTFSYDANYYDKPAGNDDDSQKNSLTPYINDDSNIMIMWEAENFAMAYGPPKSMQFDYNLPFDTMNLQGMQDITFDNQPQRQNYVPQDAFNYFCEPLPMGSGYRAHVDFAPYPRMLTPNRVITLNTNSTTNPISTGITN